MSTEPARRASRAADAAPRLLHRRARQERHDRAVRDAAPPSADLHAGQQGAVVLRDGHAPALRADARRDAARRRSRSTSSLFADAGPDAARRRGLLVLPVVAHRGGAHRRGPAGRADHRDPARAGELPALAAPAAAADARRVRAGPAQGARARSRRGATASTSRAARTARSCCCTPTTSATSSSCAATTSVFAREQMLVLIYDDFRATTRRTVRTRAALPRRRRRRIRSSVLRGEPDDRRALAALDELVHAVSVGRGPLSQAAKAAVKALTPRTRAQAGAAAGPAAGRARRAAGRRRAVHARAAPPLPARGRGAQRVPRSRPGHAVGL